MLAFAWTAPASFSILPLRIIMTFGLIVTLFGAEEAVRAILAHVFHWYTVRGWTEPIVVVSVSRKRGLSIWSRGPSTSKRPNRSLLMSPSAEASIAERSLPRRALLTP
jgi:hypothetical protein